MIQFTVKASLTNCNSRIHITAFKIPGKILMRIFTFFKKHKFDYVHSTYFASISNKGDIAWRSKFTQSVKKVRIIYNENFNKILFNNTSPRQSDHQTKKDYTSQDIPEEYFRWLKFHSSLDTFIFGAFDSLIVLRGKESSWKDLMFRYLTSTSSSKIKLHLL